MRFVNVRQLHNKTSEILAATKRDDPVIVTRYGKPVAVINRLEAEELEDFVLLNHPRFKEALDEARADLSEGRMTDLDRLIATTGKKRALSRTPGSQG